VVDEKGCGACDDEIFDLVQRENILVWVREGGAEHVDAPPHHADLHGLQNREALEISEEVQGIGAGCV